MSNSEGAVGVRGLNPTADPLFRPPAARHVSPFGAVGSGRPASAPPHPATPARQRSNSAPLPTPRPLHNAEPASVHPGPPMLPPIPGRAPTSAQTTVLQPIARPPATGAATLTLAPIPQRQPGSGGLALQPDLASRPPSLSASPGPRPDHVSINMPPVAAQASGPSLRQKAGSFAPLVDGSAAAFSLAASRVASGSTAATATGVVSGLLWSGSAGLSEAGNTQPYSRMARAANALNGFAGAFSTGAAASSGDAQTALGYLSSGAWGLSALGSIAHAALDSSRNRLSRGLQAAGGVANLAAAGLSAAATHAAADNDNLGAAWYGTASSLSWMAGSIFSYASMRTASSPSPRVATTSAPAASTPLQISGPPRSFGTNL